jgi:hypothetical protein
LKREFLSSILARVLDLGPRARVLFAAAWIAAQAALVLTANRRADRAFGFQMFSESSTINVHLLRRVDSITGNGTTLVPVENGEWVAKDRAGSKRRIKWRERVEEPALGVFDQTIHASYGAAAQLARIQAALDDVASHTPDDTETRQLVAEITVRKNGREPYVVTLQSAPR